MSTIKFSVTISAPAAKVWDTLWNDETYRQWTAAFMPGSYAESDWLEGSPIRFLAPGGNGMFSIIEKKIPNVQMTFKHLGELKNAVEVVKDWGGAREHYFLKEENGITQLDVEMDATPEMQTYLENTFPKALAILKQIAGQ